MSGAVGGRLIAFALLGGMLLVGTGSVSAQVERSPAIQVAIDRGAAYLLSRTARNDLGQDALAALALIKCDVPKSDPSLAARLERVFASVAGNAFEPRNEHNGIYSAGIIAMVLGALDRSLYGDGIEKVARYIMEHQNPNGSWNYPNSPQKLGDTSVTQYAMLGLWEAAMAAVDVPPAVFDKAAGWHVEVQDGTTGAFGYRHEGEGNSEPRDTMTAGALGSLMICLRRGPTAKPVLKHKLLIPIIPEGAEGEQSAQFLPTASASDIRRAVARADNRLVNRFNAMNPSGQSHYYYFYALERYAALAEAEKIGTLRTVDWYQDVSERLLADQQSDGSWRQSYGALIDTSFVLLFLTRATKHTLLVKEEAEKFGGGILVGGRGLPKDFTQVAVQNEGLVVKPLQGSLDQLLGMLQTQSGSTLEGAAAGLEEALRQSDPATLHLGLRRLEELADDPRALTRQVAVWALARQERLEVTPILIQALDDRALTVRQEALAGLRVLSRKYSENRDWTRAADWKAWYRTLDPKWHWQEP